MCFFHNKPSSCGDVYSPLIYAGGQWISTKLSRMPETHGITRRQYLPLRTVSDSSDFVAKSC
nr:MAG TPA: hypothetical protein [Caudoviricetes sp.]